MKQKYYYWHSETSEGTSVHLGAVAHTELEARWAVLLELDEAFDHAEIDKTPLENPATVVGVETLVMIMSDTGV